MHCAGGFIVSVFAGASGGRGGGRGDVERVEHVAARASQRWTGMVEGTIGDQ